MDAFAAMTALFKTDNTPGMSPRVERIKMTTATLRTHNTDNLDFGISGLMIHGFSGIECQKAGCTFWVVVF